MIINKKIISIVNLLVLLVIGVGILRPFEWASADDGLFGLKTAAQTAKLDENSLEVSKKDLPTLIGDTVGIALSLIGIIFFLLMLYAGIRWMTALGNGEQVQKAKDTLEHAAIGLVIALAAYAITTFVFTSFGIGEEPGVTKKDNASLNTDLCSQFTKDRCQGPYCTWDNGSCKAAAPTTANPAAAQ